MIQPAAFLLIGVALLVIGADRFVTAASRIGERLKMTPLIVGLTIVAFGTSAPEAAVSIQAAGTSASALVVGNVLGSCIFNILFVLGISAMITPLAVSRPLVMNDVPIMLVAGLTVWLASLDGRIGLIDAAVLLTGIILYTAFLKVRVERGRRVHGPWHPGTPPGDLHRGWGAHIVWLVAGIVLLILGSRMTVSSGLALAANLGLSELIVGATFVAVGTSLPEVATSVTAAARGRRDLAVGNVVGSNIFNLLLVLGLAGVVASPSLDVSRPAIRFDMPVMVAASVACLPIFFTGHSISRWEGAVFSLYYVAYVGFALLYEFQSPQLPRLGAAMLGFIVPLTVITLAVLMLREYRSRAGQAEIEGPSTAADST